MATRFGASSPAQSFAARVKWLVGGLIAVIVVLVLTLVFVSKGSAPTPAGNTTNDAVATVNSNAPTVSILYTAQRIEANTSLLPHMFIEKPISPDRIPEGAVLGRDKPTIVGKYSKALMTPDSPLRRDDITDNPPPPSLPTVIPAGYRGVTIVVDARSGVEGWARPGTRVDVLLSYNDKSNNKKVATVVNFSKVLSVGGLANNGQPENKAAGTTTITLLVTELDAKKIELARSIGTLSLALVGEAETPTKMANSGPIDPSALFPTADKPVDPTEPEPDGVMWAPDPETGKNCKYELFGRKWKKSECS